MTEAYVKDGDLGSGKPGALSWHKCVLAQLSRNEKIAHIRASFLDMADEDKLEIAVFLIVEAKQDGDGN